MDSLVGRYLVGQEWLLNPTAGHGKRVTAQLQKPNTLRDLARRGSFENRLSFKFEPSPNNHSRSPFKTPKPTHP